MLYALAFATGIVAGLRSMIPPAALCWAARFGWIDLQNTWAAFLATPAAPYIVSLFALAELIGDKLPKTPSRKSPGPFVVRIIVGAFSGAVLCTAANQSALVGAVLGVLGAVVGTLGGYEARTRLVKSLKVPDIVIALAEDAVAIGTALFLVSRLN